MNDPLSPRAQLFLWRLAASGGGDWLKEIKPDIKKDRRRLKEAGLIEEEKRKRPESGGHAKPLYITLTDRGWAWLSDHFEAELPPRANAAETLRRLLAKIKDHLELKQLSLAEFLRPSRDGGAVQPPEIGRQIETAYYRLSGGQPNVRVRLADLRAALPDLPPEQVNAALLNLESRGRATLYPLDNPLEIRPEDREAVVRTSTGDVRHIVYLGGPAS
jgi:hypothetical protein